MHTTVRKPQLTARTVAKTLFMDLTPVIFDEAIGGASLYPDLVKLRFTFAKQMPRNKAFVQVVCESK